MIRVRASAEMPASADRVWALLTDWERHSRWIPATEVRVLSGDGGLGTTFVGRSSAALAIPGLRGTPYPDQDGTAGMPVGGSAAGASGRVGALLGRAGALLGRVGFDDPMTVTVFEPPSGSHAGRCEIVKTGSVVLGTAGFTVVPHGPDLCAVTWWEDVEVAPARLTRWADPLAARVATSGFDRVLAAVARDL
ncbi:MAG TPA: SRPBCC family protein [Candidatus Nanopelagicales bacterium]|nr:SRPBCC family protein [Candidatus Nanopelagicales bacterium]